MSNLDLKFPGKNAAKNVAVAVPTYSSSRDCLENSGFPMRGRNESVLLFARNDYPWFGSRKQGKL